MGYPETRLRRMPLKTAADACESALCPTCPCCLPNCPTCPARSQVPNCIAESTRTAQSWLRKSLLQNQSDRNRSQRRKPLLLLLLSFFSLSALHLFHFSFCSTFCFYFSFSPPSSIPLSTRISFLTCKFKINSFLLLSLLADTAVQRIRCESQNPKGVMSVFAFAQHWITWQIHVVFQLMMTRWPNVRIWVQLLMACISTLLCCLQKTRALGAWIQLMCLNIYAQAQQTTSWSCWPPGV